MQQLQMSFDLMPPMHGFSCYKPPKCGFLPFSRYISEGNVVEKRIVRFRMHQSLKLHEREVSEISEYDPLNMFSGSKDRVYKAIKALFVTPQNNFRVFLNGSIIYGGLGGGGNSISHMIGKEDILSSVIRTDDGLRTTNILHLVAKTVFRSGLLDQLLKLQKLDVRLRSNFAKMASYAPLFVNANDRRCMEFPISGCNAFFSESSGGTLLNSTLQANSSSSLIASAIAWKNS